jgi:hypothetical protein
VLQRQCRYGKRDKGFAEARISRINESAMLDMVKNGVGMNLVRDAIAMREAQARGLVIEDQVSLACELSFVCLAERAEEPVIEVAWGALDAVWE